MTATSLRPRIADASVADEPATTGELASAAPSAPRPWTPLRAEAGPIAAAVALALVATLANVALMGVSGWFVTAMAAAGIAGQAMNYFAPAALIRLLAILRTGGRYGERVVSHDATLRLSARRRGRLFARLAAIGPGAVTDLRSADLGHRIKADVDRLELVLLRLVVPVAVAAISAIVIVGFVHVRAPALAPPLALAMVAVGFGLPVVVTLAGGRSARAATEAAAALDAEVVDAVEGLAAAAADDVDGALWDGVIARHEARLAAEARQAAIGTIGEAAVGLAGGFGVVAVLAVGVPLVVSGALPGPDLTLAALLALASVEVCAPLPAAFAALGGTWAAARRVLDLARRPPAIDWPKRGIAPTGHAITLEDVRFAYAPGARPILDRVTARFEAGARVAVLGESGVGKTTLRRLLAREIDPDAGTIRLGGVALAELDEETLHRLVAVVPQAPHVFTASLRDNVGLGDPTRSDAAIAEALVAAGLPLDDARWSDGLDAPLGAAGTKISGGELRRLALARAFVLDRPILLLDEPSEGLDSLTEAALARRLRALDRGKTVVLFTHSAIVAGAMDTVLTLHDGRLAAAENGAIRDYPSTDEGLPVSVAADGVSEARGTGSTTTLVPAGTRR